MALPHQAVSLLLQLLYLLLEVLDLFHDRRRLPSLLAQTLMSVL